MMLTQDLTQDQLRLAIQVLGGPKAASRMLGCSDTLVRHWLAGRRPISAEKAWRLRELIAGLAGTLPGVAYNLKVAAQQAEARLMQWRARRPRFQPLRGDKPKLSPFERSERRWRDREVADRVAAGEPIAALAEEWGGTISSHRDSCELKARPWPFVPVRLVTVRVRVEWGAPALAWALPSVVPLARGAVVASIRFQADFVVAQAVYHATQERVVHYQLSTPAVSQEKIARAADHHLPT
jgi:hypothetical protein